MAQVVLAFQGAVLWSVARERLALLINKVCRLLAEILHGHPLKFLERNVADGGQNHGIGAVVVRHEVEDVLPLEAFYQVSGAQDVT